MITLPSTNEMERAYRQSDASYDGIFLLGVRTTGIFCRPSCPARKPLARNVEYFATARDALFAGYRPCKRCRPLDTSGQPPGWVAKLLADIERAPTERISDADLRVRGVDPARARRYFLKQYGMTFQAYSRARRLGAAFSLIREGANLNEVVNGNGYESHSGFRDAFVRTFGQPPGRSRGTDCIVTDWIESPLGPLVAGATAQGICLLEFTDRRMFEAQLTTLQKHFHCAIVPGHNDHIRQLKEELVRYFAGNLKEFTVPVVYPGSPFQRRVWEGLLRIPYGETRSYEDLARAIGARGSQRAVGRANGLNRIAIVIPCHRVVNKDGQLGGYGGGLWRKRFLLNLEWANCDTKAGRVGRVRDGPPCSRQNWWDVADSSHARLSFNPV
ncbi:MAG: bifunctional transcriptional activator/DNA repair protein Ada [Planctomycetes bacterium]|nr:bifunctional transcriptional activator/DNA repair protein Ada [Planctomycetota bacterium]